jgi:hypothetical protein
MAYLPVIVPRRECQISRKEVRQEKQKMRLEETN